MTRRAAVLVSGFALGVVALNVARAQDSPPGSPFDALWAAITDLQRQIAEIQLLPGPPGPQGSPGPRGPQGVGALRVIDSTGQDVGPYFFAGAAEFLGRLESNGLVLIPIRPEGFVEFDLTLVFWHTTPDCSGIRYLEDVSTTIGRIARVRGDAAAYAVGPVEQLTVGSNEQFQAGSDLLSGAGGFCDSGPQPASPLSLRRAEIADLSNIIPPLGVQ